MNLGLGTVRQNFWLAVTLAVAIVGWAVYQVIQFARSDTVVARLEASDDQPAIDMFGGRFTAGNVVELTVAKADLGHLQGFISFCGYARPIAVAVVLLFGLVFLYRFCVDVISGTPFTTRANLDLALVGAAVVAYPLLPGIFSRLGNNSVIGALDLDAVDTPGSVVSIWVACGIAVFLQMVYSVMGQGARLVKDNEGLV